MITIQKIAAALYFALIGNIIFFGIKRIRNEREKQKKIDAAWAQFKSGQWIDEIKFHPTSK